jgi:transcriptional regulator with XRE-family HTH domain
MKQRRVTEPDPATKATARDVAEETGVSVATVSRVLNGRGSVAPHTRRLVHEAVDHGTPAPRISNRRALPVGGGHLESDEHDQVADRPADGADRLLNLPW